MNATDILAALVLLLAGATLAGFFALGRAVTELRWLRAQSRQQVAHWQREAERAKSLLAERSPRA
jgi:hypothetical protein